MAHRIGVTLDEDKIEALEVQQETKVYDYVIACEELYHDGKGNGRGSLTILDKDDNETCITKDRWKIESRVISPFNWSGTFIQPKITDPLGKTREIMISGYSASIFKGLSYSKDILALFNVLDDYCSHYDWFSFDTFRVEREQEKDLVIEKLNQNIANLEIELVTSRGII